MQNRRILCIHVRIIKLLMCISIRYKMMLRHTRAFVCRVHLEGIILGGPKNLWCTFYHSFLKTAPVAPMLLEPWDCSISAMKWGSSKSKDLIVIFRQYILVVMGSPCQKNIHLSATSFSNFLNPIWKQTSSPVDFMNGAFLLIQSVCYMNTCAEACEEWIMMSCSTYFRLFL